MNRPNTESGFIKSEVPDLTPKDVNRIARGIIEGVEDLASDVGDDPEALRGLVELQDLLNNIRNRREAYTAQLIAEAEGGFDGEPRLEN